MVVETTTIGTIVLNGVTMDTDNKFQMDWDGHCLGFRLPCSYLLLALKQHTFNIPCINPLHQLSSTANNMIKFILKLLGYEYGRNSILFINMVQFTNSSWLTDIQNNGNLHRYLIKK